jgi:hypothetical protein
MDHTKANIACTDQVDNCCFLCKKENPEYRPVKSISDWNTSETYPLKYITKIYTVDLYPLKSLYHEELASKFFKTMKEENIYFINNYLTKSSYENYITGEGKTKFNCEYNATVASSVGKYEISKIWNTLAKLLGQRYLAAPKLGADKSKSRNPAQARFGSTENPKQRNRSNSGNFPNKKPTSSKRISNLGVIKENYNEYDDAFSITLDESGKKDTELNIDRNLEVIGGKDIEPSFNREKSGGVEEICGVIEEGEGRIEGDGGSGMVVIVVGEGRVEGDGGGGMGGDSVKGVEGGSCGKCEGGEVRSPTGSVGKKEKEFVGVEGGGPGEGSGGDGEG